MCLEGNSADSTGLFQVFTRCLGNYSELMTDPQFWTSLKNTVLWMIMYPIAAVVGLAFALFFHLELVFAATLRTGGIRVEKSWFAGGGRRIFAHVEL
jgi:ABC-type sugar transport system permease subunit